MFFFLLVIKRMTDRLYLVLEAVVDALTSQGPRDLRCWSAVDDVSGLVTNLCYRLHSSRLFKVAEQGTHILCDRAGVLVQSYWRYARRRFQFKCADFSCHFWHHKTNKRYLRPPLYTCSFNLLSLFLN